MRGPGGATTMIPRDTRARSSPDTRPRQHWTATYEELSAADRHGTLEPADLERLAMTAFLVGKEPEHYDNLARAYRAFAARAEPARAARCAFWIALGMVDAGDRAQAAGWVARARRLLEHGPHDCVEHGYLLVPSAMQSLIDGDLAQAQVAYAEAIRIGERFEDVDLVSLARQGYGRTMIRLGETTRGLDLLDEVMVGVTAGELSPVVAGVVYCAAIAACFDIFDMRRVGEWTEALRRWCAAQPDMVAFHGECLIYRVEILALQGQWREALGDAERACESFSRRVSDDRAFGARRLGCGTSPAGAAFYERAELHRLRGEIAKAEEGYRAASEYGRTPHPGLALLRLAQGRIDAAAAAISRVLDEFREPRYRPRLLAAGVEIRLAARDVPAARRGAEELSAIARSFATPYVQALAAQATGAVLLAEGETSAALVALRGACTIWRQLGAPYETATTTVLIGLACRARGDADAGEMEWDGARRVFQQLGAATEITRLEQIRQTAASKGAGGLTGRELEVLGLVASGKTNRMIARELAISEKTVARHLSNIFTKLDLPSRAAATAYAFQHGLLVVPPPTSAASRTPARSA